MQPNLKPECVTFQHNRFIPNAKKFPLPIERDGFGHLLGKSFML